MSRAHVVVVGAGGNIGSHLVPHLGRMAYVGRVTLIDGDRYDTSNVAGQDISPYDVGRPKSAVQAARLRKITPALSIDAHRCRVEAMPLGALGADVILACLDSRAARQYVNEAAWRLGTPWIDAGVEGGQLLARVNVYRPALDAPCLECAWDDSDYAALEQLYPCGRADLDRATRAPSSLGALAAALQALECQKLLTGLPTPAIPGRQVLVDAGHHTHHVTSYRRNPACARADHEPWVIQRLGTSAAQLTIEQALALSQPAGIAISVAGRRFARGQTCAGCGRLRRGWAFVSAFASGATMCRRCGGRFISAGDVHEELTAEMAHRNLARRSLAGLGVRDGDILTIRTVRGEARYEIGCDLS